MSLASLAFYLDPKPTIGAFHKVVFKAPLRKHWMMLLSGAGGEVVADTSPRVQSKAQRSMSNFQPAPTHDLMIHQQVGSKPPVAKVPLEEHAAGLPSTVDLRHARWTKGRVKVKEKVETAARKHCNNALSK